MDKLADLLEKIKNYFSRRESVYTEDILRHRTWRERQVQEQIINREIKANVGASSNWFDKYL